MNSVDVAARELGAELDRGARSPTFRDDCVTFLKLFRGQPTSCSAAIVHPLGFAIFRWDFSPAAALRFHVWSDLTEQVDLTVDARHDHRWRLRSYVLVGELTDHILDVQPVASAALGLGRDHGDVWEIASVVQQSETDVVAPTGELVRAIESDVHMVRAGEFYSVPPGAIHWTEAGAARPLATVVSATVEEDMVPRTLIPPGSAGRPVTPREQIEPGLRALIVDAVLEALVVSPGASG